MCLEYEIVEMVVLLQKELELLFSFSFGVPRLLTLVLYCTVGGEAIRFLDHFCFTVRCHCQDLS